MAPNDAFARPSFSKVLLSFGVGILVGIALVFPAARDDLTRFALENPGPVGNVLVIGVLSIMVLTTGIFALYQLFWLVDR